MRRLLHLGIELLQHRLHRADDERQRHEHQAEHDRRLREGDVDVDRRLWPVEREQRQPGDDRRQREGEVDDRVHERLAAEVVADEHPRGDRPSTAFSTETASDATSVSLSAATASGLETASQNDCEPSLVASHMSAAMGNRTRTERKSVMKPTDRAVAALSE